MQKSFLVINRIMLLSLKEEKAKEIIFDKRRTIITSEETAQGKSSLVKSIYYTFGCEVKFNPRWVKTDFISIVEYSIKGINYSVYRDRSGVIAFFDDNGELIKIFENNIRGVSKYLAQKLDFDMKFSDNNGELDTPPINFFFSLFYFDQDTSKEKTWAGFIHNSKKSYMSNITDEVILYHAGKRDNETYRLQSEKTVLNKKINEINKERRVLSTVKRKAEDEIKNFDYIADKELFEREITELVKEINEIGKIQFELRSQLNELNNRHIILVHQIRTANRQLKENNKDYEFVISLENELECPLCGTIHENSFINRFSMVNDNLNLEQVTNELYAEDNDVKIKIEKLQNDFEKENIHYNSLTKILNTKKEKLKFEDYINSRSQKYMSDAFSSQIEVIDKELSNFAGKRTHIHYSLNAIRKDNKEQSKKIDDFYVTSMSRYLSALDARMNSDHYKSMKITNINKETGSTGFRGLIAHFYTMLRLSYKYTKYVFCPIIIDTINQDGQTDDTVDLMTKFLDEKQPENSQLILILGKSELERYDMKGKVIELKQKHSLLRDEEYYEISNFFKPFLKQISENRNRTLF